MKMASGRLGIVEREKGEFDPAAARKVLRSAGRVADGDCDCVRAGVSRKAAESVGPPLGKNSGAI